MTTTKLKIIALIAMFIDHVGAFIPNTPEWFRWIGRIAIPIFIYGVVVGYEHTSNRKKYLLRLYFANLGMALLVMLINLMMSDTQNPLYNNFIASLFVMAFVIHILEKKQFKYILLFLLWQIIVFIICVLLAEILNVPNLSNTMASYYFWGSILGSILFVEGGPMFILLGVTLYFFSSNKIKQSIVFSFYSFCFFMASYKFGHRYDALFNYSFPFADYQWLMIAAVPFILLYNGKKGKGLKYFFYIFYPSHIIILYLIGVFLLR